MKRTNKRFNCSVVSGKVDLTSAANYTNGDGSEVGESRRAHRSSLTEMENEEESGGKAFYRLPRRLNSGLLKTISRKLPCLNHRRNSSSSDVVEVIETQAQPSPDSNLGLKERSSGRQMKGKSRGVCPVTPQPLKIDVNVGNVSRKPSVSLVRHSEVVVNGDCSAKNVCEDLCSASGSSSTSRVVPQVPFKSCSSSVCIEVYSPKIKSLTMELYRLAKYGWYWGPISRSEAEERLHGQPDGAFLVRDSSDDRYLLSLSFRSFDKTLHTRIEHSNGMFSFYVQPETESHASVVELIEHSMSYSQSGVFCYSKARTPGAPSYPVRLTRPVSRFTQVRSLQYLCRFVIRQYTRVDLIQDLPLPNRIKGYIKEAHY